MSERPRFTVYIAAHNVGRFLSEAIESVLRQTVDDWELIIIDDNSQDNTPEVLKLYQGDPRIRILTTEGLGLPGVCNLALRQARGRYLIRLDGDDMFDENILLILGNMMDREEDLALVFPDYYLTDEHGQIFAHERREKLHDANHLLDAPPNGACTLVRRSIMEELGGYREDLGAQDGFDLWSKIKDSHRSANVNLPLFFYRRHENNLTNKTERIMSARRAIKRDAIAARLEEFRPIIGVVPCRRHYDFVPDLWDQPINGHSLLELSLKASLASPVLDKVVVACDNPEAEKVLAGFDDPRLSFFPRETRNTIRSTPLTVTLRKIAAGLDPEFKGLSVVNYIQTPFVTGATMEEAIFTLIMNGADSAIGVEEINAPLFKRSGHGMRPLNRLKGGIQTDFDAVFRETWTSLATRNSNLKQGSLSGARVANFVLSEEECFFINSERSLLVARTVAQELK